MGAWYRTTAAARGIADTDAGESRAEDDDALGDIVRGRVDAAASYTPHDDNPAPPSRAVDGDVAVGDAAADAHARRQLARTTPAPVATNTRHSQMFERRNRYSDGTHVASAHASDPRTH